MKSLLINIGLGFLLVISLYNYYQSYKEWKNKNELLNGQLLLEKKTIKEKIIYIEKENKKLDEKKTVIIKTSDSCLDNDIPCDIYVRLFTGKNPKRSKCFAK